MYNTKSKWKSFTLFPLWSLNVILLCLSTKKNSIHVLIFFNVLFKDTLQITIVKIDFTYDEVESYILTYMYDC